MMVAPMITTVPPRQLPQPSTGTAICRPLAIAPPPPPLLRLTPAPMRQAISSSQGPIPRPPQRTLWLATLPALLSRVSPSTLISAPTAQTSLVPPPLWPQTSMLTLPCRHWIIAPRRTPAIPGTSSSPEPTHQLHRPMSLPPPQPRPCRLHQGAARGLQRPRSTRR